MSDPILAVKDAAIVLAEALAKYKEVTGVTLAPADPRRLHLQTFVLLLAQLRALIDDAGKQSLLRFVREEWITELDDLWGKEPLPAKGSECIGHFFFPNGIWTVPAGARITDGTSQWEVVETVSGEVVETDFNLDHLSALVRCTTLGAGTNGIAIGQIDTLVDPDEIPNCTRVSNATETKSGRDVEALEDYRERLRDVPESRSTCGPRVAYEAAALEASQNVADSVALGPNDDADMAGVPPGPGEVFVLVTEGERDGDGALVSVVPDPDVDLLDIVAEALSAEDVRPLTDSVTVKAPEFVDFDCIVTYYIARSRSDSAADIQEAAEQAFDAYLLWQQSSIGRDINPSELTARLVVAGAKRVAITSPSFAALQRDQSARLYASTLTYGGVEDD